MPAMASFPLFLVLVVVLASPWAVLGQETGPDCFEPGQCTNSLNVEEWTGVPVRTACDYWAHKKKVEHIEYRFQQGGELLKYILYVGRQESYILPELFWERS